MLYLRFIIRTRGSNIDPKERAYFILNSFYDVGGGGHSYVRPCVSYLAFVEYAS